MVINEYIKDVMDEKGKSVSFVSRKTGYPINKVVSIINSKRNVSTNEASVILNTLDISLSDVLSMY